MIPGWPSSTWLAAGAEDIAVCAAAPLQFRADPAAPVSRHTSSRATQAWLLILAGPGPAAVSQASRIAFALVLTSYLLPGIVPLHSQKRTRAHGTRAFTREATCKIRAPCPPPPTQYLL